MGTHSTEATLRRLLSDSRLPGEEGLHQGVVINHLDGPKRMQGFGDLPWIGIVFGTDHEHQFGPLDMNSISLMRALLILLIFEVFEIVSQLSDALIHAI